MQDTYYLENVDQIKAIGEPTRWRMLNLLITEQMTGAQLARRLKIPRPRAHYHLKTLERVGLVQFQEERTRNGMVEKYYRAIAKSYLTDRLIAHGRELPIEHEDAQQTGAAVSEIIRAMLELASADVLHPDSLNALLHIAWDYQEEIYVDPTELNQVKDELRSMVNRLYELDHRGRSDAGRADLVRLRVTLLLTPASAFDFKPISHLTLQGQSAAV